MKSREISKTKERITDAAIAEAKPRLVAPGTVLFSFKLSVGKVSVTQVPLYTNEAIAALYIRRPDELDTQYLARALVSLNFRGDGNRAVMGMTLNRPMLEAIRIPLPPLPEQRRIASILDQAADAKVAAEDMVTGVDELIASRYIELFEVGYSWPEELVGEMLEIPLRNGVSPSTNGSYTGEVLTLSAVTQGRFDPDARKTALFERPLGGNSVKQGELLICRGNGNRNLVGRGEIATESMHDVGFPDTMIAARFRPTQLAAAYVQSVWHRPNVRRQIDAGARTTNGTFKVNQQTLESIVIPVPPLDLQSQFGEFVDHATELRAAYVLRARLLDELFASLQHRAFTGQL